MHNDLTAVSPNLSARPTSLSLSRPHSDRLCTIAMPTVASRMGSHTASFVPSRPCCVACTTITSLQSDSVSFRIAHHTDRQTHMLVLPLFYTNVKRTERQGQVSHLRQVGGVGLAVPRAFDPSVWRQRRLHGSNSSFVLTCNIIWKMVFICTALIGSQLSMIGQMFARPGQGRSNSQMVWSPSEGPSPHLGQAGRGHRDP